jgi:multicomponent K+:H+ antiporter subunit A
LQRQFNLHLHHPPRITARLLFTHAIHGLFSAARRVTALQETGSLQRYAMLLVAASVVVAGWAMLRAGVPLQAGTRALLPASPLALVLWGILLAAGAALVLGHHASKHSRRQTWH